MRHAVFATEAEGLIRSRVTGWVDWNAAQDVWTALDDRRRAGELPLVKFFEVRSQDDPAYNGLAYEPWNAVPVEERPQWVKLTRGDRARLLDIESAADAMFTELAADGEWSHLAAVTISDYAWAAARFCFPQEAKYL